MTESKREQILRVYDIYGTERGRGALEKMMIMSSNHGLVVVPNDGGTKIIGTQMLPQKYPQFVQVEEVILPITSSHGTELTQETPVHNRENRVEYLISIKGDYYKGRILECLLHAFLLYSSFLISLILVCVCSTVSMGSSYWQNKPGVNYGRIEIDSALKHWSAQFTSGRASVFTETWLSSAPRVIRCVIQ